MNVDVSNFDVIVIGAGIAGCSAALAAARRGAKVALLTKLPEPSESNTRYAQGGIIYTAPDDSPELLAHDILAAGDGAGSPEAAMLLAAEGPELVRRLLIEELEVPFDRDGSGELLLTREGAHSVARIVHHRDTTGDAIQTALTKAVLSEPRIRTFLDAEATDLLASDGTCFGVRAEVDGDESLFFGDVILATGGFGALYSHTTNPPSATGDGLALAMRAGATVRDLRYVQFHPTVLYDPASNEREFLVSEAVRGEGAILRAPDGEPFVGHPLGSLAPRDVVTREIVAMMQIYDSSCAFLDATSRTTGRPEGWFEGRFPTIYARCLSAGTDPDCDYIPVVAAAHYTCGGVVTDPCGRTNVAGLWAVGEVASTGLHGANRLASTSLLEGLVWGWRAGENAASCPATEPDGGLSGTGAVREPAPESVWEELREVMWERAGISRDAAGLEAGLAEVSRMHREFGGTDISGALDVAEAVMRDARDHPNGRGCHFRSDDPSREESNAKGRIRVGRRTL